MASGRLHRVHIGVYSVAARSALSREALWLAAVLRAGVGAALSHHSAADLHGVARWPAPRIEVVAPRLRVIDGVRVHRYRRLDPRDLTTHRRIPVTTIHRLFVDLSDVLIAHELTAVIHEAAFRGRFVESAVRDSMRRANGRHNLHVLERAIDLYNAGSAGLKSRGERAFLKLVVRHGIPEPLVNTHLFGFEVDFHWPERKLVVEVDGGGHGRPTTMREDARRVRELEANGWAVVRFTDTEVIERPEHVLAVLG